MSEAKCGDDRRHHCFLVFRFAHTGYWLKIYTFNRTSVNKINCEL
ncbi:hypothetical protein L1M68_09020 [Coxiella burnetii]|nr:hypothetical protein [Coxiella burnetii]MCF2094408.1 hypothetical protein [Coxiella burnetii]MCF2095677.1 hypothetical protein [Coxiella burnetii]MCF2098453.1 hypothetical protein [Coxiella burnetii]MCF2100450.1 hypothetical protein [Coxiella burnetii]MCF2101987.1 hypothetical protein [Coxiella burnetii]